ncbi:DUF3169 family protein [Salinicoccus albus]|uniref:DUF3169 family protein n=1 Tax=Salinicoccus albus TaxID=418756 RepID=UPI000361A8A6|nr:DUF3169 family protein [Salinicoccus albus]
MSKTILSYILYAIAGFVTVIVIVNFDPGQGLEGVGLGINLITLLAAAASALYGIIGYFQLRKSAQDRNIEEDALDEYMYKKYTDNSTALMVTVVLSTVAMGSSIIYETSIYLTIASFAVLAAGLVFMSILPSILKTMYPERVDLPDPNDSNFAEKLYTASDEGEKLIMAEGLYKAFISMSSLLFIALVVLMIYSMATGNNQMLGMIMIAAILIYSNVTYALTIRNKG